jgi:hypothetical protein
MLAPAHGAPADTSGIAAELNFVELLSSPWAWHELALKGSLDRPEFRAYLRLLQLRWAAPEAFAALRSPLAMQFLHALFDTPHETAAEDWLATGVDVPHRSDVIKQWADPEFVAAAAARIDAATLAIP